MNHKAKASPSNKGASIVIVGRPNVGKSTLFNRIIRKRDAIVDDQPGVTRDTKYRLADWNGKSFFLVDTGGFFGPDDDPFTKEIQQQIEFASRDALLLLLVLDGAIGPTPADHEVVDLLRRLNKPILAVVNKIDSPKRELEMSAPFYELGLDSLHPISATQGTGVGDLLDEVVSYIPDDAPEPQQQLHIPGIALLGRPNVGKSTLLNSLCGSERSIVSAVSGTTRDPVDTEIEVNGKHYLLIDTAGVRRRGKTGHGLEHFTLVKSKAALKRCDIAFLMIDGEEGLTETDARVFSLANDEGKAAILLMNKWDLVKKDEKTSGLYARAIRERMPYLKYAPIEFISAMTHQRIHKIFPHVEKVLENYYHRVPTAELNELLYGIIQHHPPPVHKGRAPSIYYWTQVSVAPPTFVVFTNDPEAIHFSYERYLINQLYEKFDFEGTPIRMIWKKKGARRV